MKQVYICFSTDILHNGHIRILQRAAELGEVTVGLLTDEVVASYKHYPLIPLEERIAMFEGLKYVSRVVVQESLDYTDILNRLRPDIVVHGDDWLVGYQANIRQKVIETLKGWGGELVEFPSRTPRPRRRFRPLISCSPCRRRAGAASAACCITSRACP